MKEMGQPQESMLTATSKPLWLLVGAGQALSSVTGLYHDAHLELTSPAAHLPGPAQVRRLRAAAVFPGGRGDRLAGRAVKTPGVKGTHT